MGAALFKLNTDGAAVGAELDDHIDRTGPVGSCAFKVGRWPLRPQAGSAPGSMTSAPFMFELRPAKSTKGPSGVR